MRGAAGVTRVAPVLFALLVAATFGALLAAQRLRHGPAVVRGLAATRVFSPNGDGRLERAAVRFTVATPDTVAVAVVDAGGDRVRTLRRVTTHRAGEAVAATWDGRDDDGRRAPDGTYRVRLAFARQGRGLDDRRTVRLDTTAPRPLVTAASPAAAAGPGRRGDDAGRPRAGHRPPRGALPHRPGPGARAHPGRPGPGRPRRSLDRAGRRALGRHARRPPGARRDVRGGRRGPRRGREPRALGAARAAGPCRSPPTAGPCPAGRASRSAPWASRRPPSPWPAARSSRSASTPASARTAGRCGGSGPAAWRPAAATAPARRRCASAPRPGRPGCTSSRSTRAAPSRASRSRSRPAAPSGCSSCCR